MEEGEQGLGRLPVGGILERTGHGFADRRGGVRRGTQHGRLGLDRGDAAQESDGLDAEGVPAGGEAAQDGRDGGLPPVLGEGRQFPERRPDHFGQIGIQGLFQDLELFAGLLGKSREPEFEGEVLELRLDEFVPEPPDLRVLQGNRRGRRSARQGEKEEGEESRSIHSKSRHPTWIIGRALCACQIS